MATYKQVFRVNKSREMVVKASDEAMEAKIKIKEEAKKRGHFPPTPSPEQVLMRSKRRLLTEDADANTEDRHTLLSHCEIQRHQYRGKTFSWLLEHDPAYASYLIANQSKSGTGKDVSEENWFTNVRFLGEYALKFPQFVKMHEMLIAQRQAKVKAALSGDAGDMKVGFGQFRDMTYHELAVSSTPKHVRYLKEFLLPKKDVKEGTAMDRLRQYIIKQRTVASSTEKASRVQSSEHQPSVSAKPVSRSEVATYSEVVSGVRTSTSTSTSTAVASAADLVPALPLSHPPPTPPSASALVDPVAVIVRGSDIESVSARPVAVSVPEDTRRRNWNCSPCQAVWMESEMKEMGLFPGTISYNQRHCWEGKSLWRYPPSPELQRRHPAALPEPAPFYLHPMFIWAPETVCKSLCPSLPCQVEGCHGKAKRRGLGKPRVVVAEAGQYYIFATELMCDTCDIRPWSAASPKYLKLLPDCLKNMFPAKMAYNKAVDIGLVDRIRRSGRSPADVSNEVNELALQKFERRHLQYLLLLQSVREQARHGGNLDNFLGFDVDAPSIDFGVFSDVNGYCGESVSAEFITNCLVDDYEQQKSTMYCLMKGTFGSYIRSDHTRPLAKKVEAHSGAMWSYSIMNEFWEVLSWVMVESESESSLKSCYAGLGRRYEMARVEKPKFRWVDKHCCVSPPTSTPAPRTVAPKWDDMDSVVPAGQVDRSKYLRKSACRDNLNGDIVEFLDSFHCIRRLGRCCTSEAHPAYPRFISMIGNAFFVVDSDDLQALRIARRSLGWDSEPSRDELRRHCRMRIPEPYTLEKRVTAVMLAFRDVKDNRDLPLFTNQMLHEWSLQREHIRRGCLSDPLDAGGVLYRFTGYVHLGHKISDETKLSTWQSLRGSSQLEGLHPHQVSWVTGTRVSAPLFQAQAMFGVAKWNMKRAAEHRKLKMPSVFNPLLTATINTVSTMEYGSPKYPDFVLNDVDTGETFGIDYCFSGQKEALDATFITDGETSDDAELVNMDLQHKIDDLLETISSTHSDTRCDAEVDMISDDFGDPETVNVPMEAGNLPVSRDADVRAVSCAPTSTSVPKPAVGKKRKADELPDVIGSKQKPSASRRMTYAGVLTPWHPDQWTSEMKEIIKDLLVSTKSPERYKEIAKIYNRMVLDRADDKNSTLKQTNARFIQIFERQVSGDFSFAFFPILHSTCLVPTHTVFL